MGIRKKNLKDFNLVVGFFLAFSGYYAALMAQTNLAAGLDSRNVTVPLRLIIVTSIGLTFLQRPRIKMKKGLLFFLLFAAAYLSRILIEYVDSNSTFHISELEFFFYFATFVLIPMFFISQYQLSEDDYNKIFMAVMTGTLLLSVSTLYFYGDIIGTVTRISGAIKRDENYISPLALSYCSALGIGVGIAYLIAHEVDSFKKIFIYATIGTSFIPFYLGASRGSIVALSFPFIIYLLFAKNVKRRVVLLFSIGILSAAFIIITEYFGSGVFVRFANISRDIETGSSSVIRIDIWRASLMQFWNNPVFGNSLNCDYVNHHPHNILLEVLITTGFIGFIPFILFLQQIFIKIKLIVNQHSRYFWVCVIFIQAFTQNMFSGGIYAAGWLAIGSGLILCVNARKENRIIGIGR